VSKKIVIEVDPEQRSVEVDGLPLPELACAGIEPRIVTVGGQKYDVSNERHRQMIYERIRPLERARASAMSSWSKQTPAKPIPTLRELVPATPAGPTAPNSLNSGLRLALIKATLNIDPNDVVANATAQEIVENTAPMTDAKFIKYVEAHGRILALRSGHQPPRVVAQTSMNDVEKVRAEVARYFAVEEE
jgi:hypothetical protein